MRKWMRWINGPVGVLAGLLVSVVDHQGMAQESYPRVISPTGQPYGPTQAHYQYLKRYGTPYNGYSGLDIANGYPAPSAGNVIIQSPFFYGRQRPGFGGYIPHRGFGGFGPGGYYGPGYGGYYTLPPVIYAPFAGDSYLYGTQGLGPNWHLPAPPIPSGAFSPFMEDAVRQERERWEQPLVGVHPAPEPRRVIEPSTPQAQLRSVRQEAEGDRRFREMNFALATTSYREAIQIARDRAEPRIKLGLGYAAQSRFPEAIQELKLGLALDPAWPAHPVWFDDLIGQQNYSEKVFIKQRVLDWAKQDIRDPERLFLLGTMLHIDGDPRGLALFETAARLSGQQPHLMAFLAPESVAAVNAVAGAAAAERQEEPVPAPLAVPGEALDIIVPDPAGGDDLLPGLNGPTLPPLK